MSMSCETPRPRPEAEPFEYPAVGMSPGCVPPGQPKSWGMRNNNSSNDTAVAERQAFERGRQEALAEAKTRLEQALAAERHALVETVSEFENERTSYYQQVEAEIVQLALAVARKILHRESQIDPLLLSGVARVALEKLKEGTTVTLHVHPSEAEPWRAQFEKDNQLKVTPEIRGDPSLDRGHCRLETNLGACQLGLEDQMKEIEQGFLDLLSKRPSGK